jgi:putative flippase GtrA
MKLPFINKITILQFLKFSLVGLLATAIHYGIYLLTYKQMNVNIAYSIGYVVSFVFNFLLSNFFTFNTKPNVKRGVGFAISHLINYGLHIVFLNLFLFLSISDTYAPLLVYVVVFPINFILVRFAFKSKYSE